MKISKCVILAAGLSSRLYPATKVVPKPMLPIYNKPIIQILVEQVRDAGITDIAIVTSEHSNLIEDHFSDQPALIKDLKAMNKESEIAILNDIAKGLNITFFKQSQAGTAGALKAIKGWLEKQDFLLLYCDEVIFECHLTEFINAYRGSHLIFSTKRPAIEAVNYGTIIVGENCRALNIQEKVPVTDREVIDIVLGKSILNYHIFDTIEKLEADSKGELGLTEAIGLDLENVPVYVYQTNHQVHDTGNYDGYLEACTQYKEQEL